MKVVTRLLIVIRDQISNSTPNSNSISNSVSTYNSRWIVIQLLIVFRQLIVILDRISDSNSSSNSRSNSNSTWTNNSKWNSNLVSNSSLKIKKYFDRVTTGTEMYRKYLNMLEENFCTWNGTGNSMFCQLSGTVLEFY